MRAILCLLAMFVADRFKPRRQLEVAKHVDIIRAVRTQETRVRRSHTGIRP